MERNMFGHLSYTPAEWALRARAHPDAERFQDASRVMDVAAHTPGMPFPSVSRDQAAFFFSGIDDAAEAKAAVRDAETILHCALMVAFTTRRAVYGSSRHVIRTAKLPSGLKVELVALASQMEPQDAGQDLVTFSADGLVVAGVSAA
jgi:hypothetical protein